MIPLYFAITIATSWMSSIKNIYESYVIHDTLHVLSIKFIKTIKQNR